MPPSSATARSLPLNVAAVVGAQVITKAVNLAVSVAMVRWLGAEGLGQYAYIIAFCFPFGALADFGLATLATREMSRDRAREGELLAALRALVVRLTLSTSLVMVGLGLVLHPDATTRIGVAIAAVAGVTSSLTTPSLVALTAREQLGLVSFHRVVSSLLGSLAIVAVLSGGGGVLALLGASALTNVAMLVVARVLAARGGVGPVGVAPALTPWLRRAFPFGVLMVTFALYYRIDMVMLRWLSGPTEVGVYAAAYRFLDAVVILAASLGGPFFPRLSHVAGTEPERARGILEDVWRPLLALGLPLTVGTLVLADDLVRVLFGPAFAEGGTVVRVLILAALPLFWVNLANHAVIAGDRVSSLAAIYGAGLVLNVVGNLALAPALGAAGAAIATTACEWINLILVVTLVRGMYGVSFSGRGLWRYAVAAAVMAILVRLVQPFGLVGAIGVGMFSYPGALLGLGYRQSRDMVTLKRLLAR